MEPLVDLDLSENAKTVLERRYLWKNDAGEVSEKPLELFHRVASAIAKTERTNRAAWEKRFFELMAGRRFLPNSPTLMNAGRPKAQLSACFVLPVEDSLDGIFETLRQAAKIHQSGGGTGFSFSRLRPHGSRVRTTHGVASGPVSFIRIYDATTETIKQGGARRGANMAILRVDHPDIREFVESKRDLRSILNFNISVGATDEFMRAVEGDLGFGLRDPRTGKVTKEVRAKELFGLIVHAAWESGDPGMVFLDRINLFNPTPRVGEMESTNPCVTGGARVFVKGRGLMRIGDLSGKQPEVSTELSGRTQFATATAVFRTGLRPVYRLQTVEGYELKLTEDHRVGTERGDIPAVDLERGDRIRLMEVAVPQVDFNSSDARFGEIVGWLTGDGHFTFHEENKPTLVLNFYGEDKREVGPRLLRSVHQLLNDQSLSLCAVEARDLEYLRSQRLRQELQERGITQACKERVPERVWRGSADLVSGYLRGLFSADGSVQGSIEKGLSVRLCSIHLELLKDVQLLLLSLGIKSVLYANRRTAGMRSFPDGKGGKRDYYCENQHELVVSKASLGSYQRAVGFLIARKSKDLSEKLGSFTRGPYRQSFYATVDSLTFEGEQEVYDLTEPESHHFHAQGMLVHNCGEQPLLPYESCNLGSLNLGQYFVAGSFDWDAYRKDIHTAVRFLDNVIEVNVFPVAECAKITRANRKIGLGVMGFADLLLMLDLPYASPNARAWGEKLMSFLDREAKIASTGLARERGPFANWKGSMWERLGYPKLRNATVTTVAPTGTISIIAGASSGIEPIFSGMFYRNVLSGEKLVEIHPAVARVLEDRGRNVDEMTEEKIAASLGESWSPARKVPVADHVRMQALFQRHSDSAVSKTINLPEKASTRDVAEAYLLAYRLGCKGITIYRDRSRKEQVLEQYCPSC